jgi:hypothetical protein
MSSELFSSELADRDVIQLTKVLLDAGYTGTTLQGSERMNVAAELVIRLLHEGVTDPLHFTTELEDAFGRPPVPLYVANSLHRYAIQGLPPGNDQRVPLPNGNPKEKRNVTP